MGTYCEGVHAHLWVVHLHLDVAAVDDVYDAIYGEAGLGNVRRHNALARPRWGLLENLGLKNKCSW